MQKNPKRKRCQIAPDGVVVSQKRNQLIKKFFDKLDRHKHQHWIIWLTGFEHR